MKNTLDYYQKLFCLSKNHAKEICSIADRVQRLWSTRQSVPYFTTHGPSHNEAIIHLLTQIIPRSMKTPDTELERYLLLVAAWLHDIGMLNLDFFTEQYRPSTVRAEHHQRSARWVVSKASELRLSSAEADIVAFLVTMHRKHEDINSCPEHMWVGTQKVRVRLAAALLRLVDALHIDETRAPLQEYLLYRMTGMPSEAKFHWVKARTVQGIDINISQGLIKIQIDIPDESEDGEFDPLANFIRQGIEEELETVRHTLAMEGVRFLMDVSVEQIRVPGFRKKDVDRAKEIGELNNLIGIDVSPNARTLVNVILDSIEQIDTDIQRELTAKRVLETLEALRDYAKDLVPKVVARSCHVAVVRVFGALVCLLQNHKPKFDWYASFSLFTLLEQLKLQVKTQAEMEKSLTKAIEQIRFPTNDEACRTILHRVHKYFRWERNVLVEAIDGLSQEVCNSTDPILLPTDRILLYGTSASVIDLLGTIATQTDDQEDASEIKDELEIFVAECRVKSKYATNSTSFNDGIEYASRIAGKGYKKIAIVPDAAIAHLLLPKEYYEQLVKSPNNVTDDNQTTEEEDVHWTRRSTPITKIFFGFNGLNLKKKFAVHSCGHLALTLLAKQPASSTEKTSDAKVYLVGTTTKCGEVNYKHVEPRSSKTWLTGDIGLLEKHKVADYNPVDDIIKLDLVDKVISDLGVMSPNDFIKKFNESLKEIERQFNAMVLNPNEPPEATGGTITQTEKTIPPTP